MDVSHILDGLNDRQREAVTAPVGNLLIVAGAGSGKTRVLVHRVAWLIEAEGVSPHGVLAVTFTNKAASEMRHRTEALLRMPGRSLWVGTFHGIAHRLLRTHWHEAKLPQSFQILDSDDQLRLIKRVMRALDIDETRWAPRQAQWFINGQKDEGRRAREVVAGDDLFLITHKRVYEAYEELCSSGGLVDFAELLLRSHELWLEAPDLLAHYQRRFQHLLVDEFQDTNTIQYAWLRVLAGGDRACSRGRRRRSVDLRLARRAHREHPPFSPGFSRRCDHPSRTELPVHRHHSQSRQCADRSQHRSARQAAVDQRRRRRSDRAVCRVQRAR